MDSFWSVVFVLFVIGAVLWNLTKGAKPKGSKRVRVPSRQPVSTTAVFAWPALDDFECEVVGESHYQAHLSALAGDHGDEAARLEVVATLVPDDANPYDSNAVRVEIGGQLVGYLPREDAPVYRERLKECAAAVVAATCGAIIMGGFVGRNGKRASYGVRLDIKPLD